MFPLEFRGEVNREEKMDRQTDGR